MLLKQGRYPPLGRKLSSLVSSSHLLGTTVRVHRVDYSGSNTEAPPVTGRKSKTRKKVVNGLFEDPVVLKFSREFGNTML